jgi:hypothetical protein
MFLAMSVSAWAKDRGSFSIGCLTNDTDLQTAEALASATDPAASVTVSPASLWPPNHKMRNVTLSIALPASATNLVAPVEVSLTVNDVTDDQVASDDAGEAGCGTSSKQGADWSPTDFSSLVATGPLQTTSDALVLDGLRLRGERCAKDGTRTYEISVTCCDTTNSVCDSAPEILTVVTPKSQKKQ